MIEDNKMWTTRIVDESLHRNGVLIERARREGRSLTAMERNIILCGRKIAGSVMTSKCLNGMEMLGSRDKSQVFKPIIVKACFAYFNDPFDDYPATAEFLILESNHPNLPVDGHVCEENLQIANIKTPKHPTFDKWVKAGRKIYTTPQWFYF